LASDEHSASRFWPCGHAVDPSTSRPETIGGRTARKRGDHVGSRSGSWLRPDGPSGCPSWRLPSAARLRAQLNTHEFELANLQLLAPTGRPSVFPRYFPCPEGQLRNYQLFLPQCQTLSFPAVAQSPKNRPTATAFAAADANAVAFTDATDRTPRMVSIGAGARM